MDYYFKDFQHLRLGLSAVSVIKTALILSSFFFFFVLRKPLSLETPSVSFYISLLSHLKIFLLLKFVQYSPLETWCGIL